MNKTTKPKLSTEIPGPNSLALRGRLAASECRNITCISPAPIFWRRASGANVWDVDENCFVDLTAAFGVANVGHAHPRVVAAVAEQSEKLLHGMGDVYPPEIKVELLEALVSQFPGGGPARAVLSSSGSDAVETALKTAILATGRAGVLAFEGAYHGLAFGALDTTWRNDFREPFANRLPDKTVFVPFGDLGACEAALDDNPNSIGAILVEPVQGRGGERIAPAGFLTGLASLCRREGILLIADEIYTGFCRTGRWFACEHDRVVPDLICLGKGMASGMPISACVGRAEVMDAWPISTGEALHTQTFIGHPASCAAALASMEVLAKEGLAEASASAGARALDHLERTLEHRQEVREVRGLGLMIGIELERPGAAVAACERALERGVIALPSGNGGSVISITPPLCIDPDVLIDAIDILVDGL